MWRTHREQTEGGQQWQKPYLPPRGKQVSCRYSGQVYLWTGKSILNYASTPVCIKFNRQGRSLSLSLSLSVFSLSLSSPRQPWSVINLWPQLTHANIWWTLNQTSPWSSGETFTAGGWSHQSSRNDPGARAASLSVFTFVRLLVRLQLLFLSFCSVIPGVVSVLFWNHVQCLPWLQTVPPCF